MPALDRAALPLSASMRLQATLLRAELDHALDILDLAIRERRQDLMREAVRALDRCRPRLDGLRPGVGEPA